MRIIQKIVIVACLFVAYQSTAQSIVGKWKTIDDETGKEKSIIQVYEQKGKFYGKVLEVLDKKRGNDPTCTKCTDYRKDKKIVGMVIIDGLEKKGEVFSGGEILDPEKGKTYSCKLWVEDGNLKVRGYWGMFYRTQTWYKAK